MVAYAYNSGTQKLKQKIIVSFEFEASMGYKVGLLAKTPKREV